VSPVKFELCFYIPEDGILHSHRRENLKSYIPPRNFLYSIVCFVRNVIAWYLKPRAVRRVWGFEVTAPGSGRFIFWEGHPVPIC
jgi:hypothetical protein